MAIGDTDRAHLASFTAFVEFPPRESWNGFYSFLCFLYNPFFSFNACSLVLSKFCWNCSQSLSEISLINRPSSSLQYLVLLAALLFETLSCVHSWLYFIPGFLWASILDSLVLCFPLYAWSLKFLFLLEVCSEFKTQIFHASWYPCM